MFDIVTVWVLMKDILFNAFLVLKESPDYLWGIALMFYIILEITNHGFTKM